MLIVLFSEGTPFDYSVSTIFLRLAHKAIFWTGKVPEMSSKKFSLPTDYRPHKKGLFSLTTDMNTRCPFPRFPLFYVEEKELRINHRGQSK